MAEVTYSIAEGATTETAASCMQTPVRVLAALLPIQLFVNAPGKKWKMAPVFGPLLPLWETRKEEISLIISPSLSACQIHESYAEIG